MEEGIPSCVGIIMDGNRRWAKARGLAPWEGHQEGYKKFKEVLAWGKEAGIKNVIVYAFSTENWKRSSEEVEQILQLFRHFLTHEIEGMVSGPESDRGRVRFAGDRTRFPEDIQTLMRTAEERTQEFGDYTVMIAASYGGRAEIIAAVEDLLARGERAVNEDEFSRALWTSGFPDPDLIIRTGGEQRLSNFLPWQSTYSELFFVETEWPAFSKEEFRQVLAGYRERTRNFGS